MIETVCVFAACPAINKTHAAYGTDSQFIQNAIIVSQYLPADLFQMITATARKKTV